MATPLVESDGWMIVLGMNTSLSPKIITKIINLIFPKGNIACQTI
jgi:hypothetical protein